MVGHRSRFGAETSQPEATGLVYVPDRRPAAIVWLKPCYGNIIPRRRAVFSPTRAGAGAATSININRYDQYFSL